MTALEILNKFSDILRLVLVLCFFPVMFITVPLTLIMDWLENSDEEITNFSVALGYFSWVKELWARVRGTV